MSEDILKLQELLAELPEITLPDSLTAEALFARMDAGELLPTVAEPPRATPANKVLDITRRLRPVLSYAAVFVLMVAVYYGAGMDRMTSGYTEAPMAAPMGMSVASSTAAASSDAAPAPRLAMPEAENKSADAGAAPQVTAGAPDTAPAQPENGPALFVAPADAPAPDALPAPQTAASPQLVAQVQVGELVVLEIDLATTPDGRISLPLETGLMVTLELQGGAIRFAESGCSDQQCVQAGYISMENAMVCCLKDQVLVHILSK